MKDHDLTLILDHSHNGIGTGSCGPGVQAPHELRASDFDFTMRVRPFSLDEESASIIAPQAPAVG
ncbi:MAG TPA: hypothetical protein VF624_02110 [Tepidisphaeraceae bacterium]|jgi:hypothetical protein